MRERDPTPEASVDSTADAHEIARFEALARRWWEADGPLAPLHKLNPIRLRLIRDRLAARLGRDVARPKPLEGIRLLDIGCGGGLLSEPMARLGAAVTGIDAAAKNIAAARIHAQSSGLAIDYRNVPLKTIAAEDRKFDAVLNMEVVEHVADLPAFVAAAAACLAPGGIMFTATLNRTAKSFVLAIVGAEYILGWLPRGTHRWSRFVKPAELMEQLSKAGLSIEEAVGVRYSPFRDDWFVHRDLDVNYVVVASRPTAESAIQLHGSGRELS